MRVGIGDDKLLWILLLLLLLLLMIFKFILEIDEEEEGVVAAVDKKLGIEVEIEVVAEERNIEEFVVEVTLLVEFIFSLSERIFWFFSLFTTSATFTDPVFLTKPINSKIVKY